MTTRTIEVLAFCVALLIAALAFHAWLSAHDDELRLQSTLASQKQVLDAADARERDRTAALKDTLAQIEALKHEAQTQTPQQIVSELQNYLHLPQPITIAPAASSASGSSAENRRAPARGRVSASQEGSAATAQAGNLTSSSRSSMPESPPVDTSYLPANPSPALDVAMKSTKPPANDAALVPREPISPAEPQVPKSQASPQTQSQTPASQSPAIAPSTAEIPSADIGPLYNFVQDCRACRAELAAAKENATDDARKLTAITNERDAALKAANGGSFWTRLRRNSHWLIIGAAGSIGVLCATGHCR